MILYPLVVCFVNTSTRVVKDDSSTRHVCFTTRGESIYSAIRRTACNSWSNGRGGVAVVVADDGSSFVVVVVSPFTDTRSWTCWDKRSNSSFSTVVDMMDVLHNEEVSIARLVIHHWRLSCIVCLERSACVLMMMAKANVVVTPNVVVVVRHGALQRRE